MKTSTKTLLASTISAIALACAGGAYAQGAGGGAAGAGGSAGAGAGGAGGTGAGTRGGAAPSGNTLEQPGIQPGMGNSNSMGGYGSPGSTQEGSGRSMNDMNDQNGSGTTYTPQQKAPSYNGQGQQ